MEKSDSKELDKDIVSSLAKIVETIDSIKPIDPEILNKKDLDLFDLMMPLAESCGMGWYYKQLQSECKSNKEIKLQNKQQENSEEKNMLEILNSNLPTEGKIIIVNATNGKERKAFYTWADYHNLSHQPTRIDLFDDTFIFKCEECGESNYGDDMRYQSDWSTISPGVCYGSFIECPNYCDTFIHTEDYDPYGGIKRMTAFNAIVIGHNIPKLSRKTTKRKHNKQGLSSNDLSVFNDIPVRDFVIMDLIDFHVKFTSKDNGYVKINNE
ncbi:hypothetical protein QJ850_gp436 [Acanthamoeba polyphaga mimivirus]|uniref:DUF5894 domain-containing protein n=1 Tax=Acanthamoeba polyphaga mimivirus Kroon TaxID=3069720 RepID=A0A0G2Y3B7_9VIRU|nr:hypothetical protein QJ850_gp436 [Acanthamoeba polyphaga mimivirus]AKI80263.1 hypothetical protein [Acanthamoeba polyphaga mimivirus Kroon]